MINLTLTFCQLKLFRLNCVRLSLSSSENTEIKMKVSAFFNIKISGNGRQNLE